MRYRRYEPEVNALLDVARAAERAREVNPEVSSTDIIGHLTDAAADWTWSLIEIIMDHEKRQREFRKKWKGWRAKKRR